MSEWDIGNLREFLEIVLNKYPVPEETYTYRQGQFDSITEDELRVGKKDLETYRNLIKDTGVQIVEEALDDDYILRAPNTADLAHIPYIAVLQSDESVSTKYGRYVVYLVDPYEDTAYLSLTIGASKTAGEYAKRLREVTDTQENRSQSDILRWLANWNRGLCTPPPNFSTGPIELTSSLNRSIPYGNGSIYHRKYTLDELPSNDDLVGDLNAIVETYLELLETKVSNVRLDLGDRRVWHISTEGKRWEGWSVDQVASIGWQLNPDEFDVDPQSLSSIEDSSVTRSEGQGYAFQFTQEISENDIIIAAVRGKSNPHSVYGIGKVEETAPALDTESLHESIKDDSHFIRVKWAEFDTMVPITLGTQIPLIDKTLTKIQEEEFNHVLGTTLVHAVAGGLYTSVARAVDSIENDSGINMEVLTDSTLEENEVSIEGREGTSDKNGEKIDDQKETWRLVEADRTEPRFDIDPDGIDLSNLHFKSEERLVKRTVNALKSGNHVLFVGPPGTGKSKLAQAVCDSLVGEEYKTTTATADWSTFDTIGGYRQRRDGRLEFTPGLFLKCFQNLRGKPINKWLIVDEFNRANIDKAFGSLFSVLAGDIITLPFSDEDGNEIIVHGTEPSVNKPISSNDFIVPNDWRLLATMNTFDKSSLYDLSYALSRRFSFVQVPAPAKSDIDIPLIKSYVACWPAVNPTDEEIEGVVDIWKAVQEKRPLGPAIIRDVLIASNGDLTPGVMQHVLPQFEGLMNSTQRDMLDRVAKTGHVDKTELELFGRQYFELDELNL